MFGKKKQEEIKQEEVYCQACETDLTHLGGMINNNGAIVCQSIMGDPVNCSTIYSFQSEGGFFTGDYYNPGQVQRKIREGELTHYGPLEKSVS